MPNGPERKGNENLDINSGENSRSAQQHSTHDEEEKSGFSKRV
jgi:hypothetical protein